MKESMAERTLNIQIRRMNGEANSLSEQISDLTVQRKALLKQRDALESEVLKLSKQRKASSEFRKLPTNPGAQS